MTLKYKATFYAYYKATAKRREGKRAETCVQVVTVLTHAKGGKEPQAVHTPVTEACRGLRQGHCEFKVTLSAESFKQ